MVSYTFGETALAADRLQLLDHLFAPTSNDLFSSLHIQPHRIIDLGCGPGLTTRYLRERYPRAQVIGLDASEPFLERARLSVPGCEFVAADATQPLEDGPYDLIYARFLLAHLPDIASALGVWTRSLSPQGRLVLEETEHISSGDRDFARYESLVRARVGSEGALLYAGPAITAALGAELAVEQDRVTPVELTAGQAASLFWRNLAHWGPDAVTQGLLQETERAALLDRLRRREHDATRGLFTWTQRQVVAARS